jgi:hypothetical protein
MSIENSKKLTKNLTPYIVVLGAVIAAVIIIKIYENK